MSGDHALDKPLYKHRHNGFNILSGSDSDALTFVTFLKEVVQPPAPIGKRCCYNPLTTK